MSNFLIVGLGLLGGSYAKALKAAGHHILAIDVDMAAIDYALEQEIIDEGSGQPDEYMIGRADAAVFALYPGIFKDWIRENQRFFKPGIYITDVTGVKENVVYEIQDMLRKDVEYIPAHPMAGREVGGVINSDAAIFRGANYIVTPTEKNTPEAIEWCTGLGYALGCRKVSVLSPKEHDLMIAYVSQLTHAIAVSLMTCSENAHLVDYTGDSFRDLTRIANINDVMWSELFLANKESLLTEMDAFEKEFHAIRDMVANEDTDELKAKMRLSKVRRQLFNKTEIEEKQS